VGAFQTFSRNHRDCEGSPQEPYRYKDVKVGNTTIMDIMRDAILAKYSLQKYYYTHMYLLSMDSDSLEGATFYKPLFFEYPNDPQAYQVSPSENVMLGPSLKLSIRTSPLANGMGEGSATAYYWPPGNWCDIINPETSCVYAGDEGIMYEQPSDIDQYQVSLREGHIIPW
jgi:alpha-glucosidase (family GH31 glycosyl hydrolase)